MREENNSWASESQHTLHSLALMVLNTAGDFIPQFVQLQEALDLDDWQKKERRRKEGALQEQIRILGNKVALLKRERSRLKELLLEKSNASQQVKPDQKETETTYGWLNLLQDIQESAKCWRSPDNTQSEKE